MKKFILLTALMLLTIFIVCSCGDCKHSWSSSDCENASTCSLCGLTNGSPRGHSFVNASCTAPKTCTVCQATEGEALGHSWSEAECEETPECVLCGVTGQAIEHTWAEASCTVPKTCTVCQATEGEALGHAWAENGCEQPRVCTTCNLETTEGIGHSWIFNGCLTPRSCEKCSATEDKAPGHSYVEASCTLPSYCSVCKKGKGVALGHNWAEANCTRAKCCTRCNLTEGEPLGHTWSFYEYIAPTCSEGQDVYACICGEKKITYYPATIFYHVCDKTGLCSTCNVTFDTAEMELLQIVANGAELIDCCGAFSSTQTSSMIYKPIVYGDIGMPIVELSGSMSGISKDNYVTLDFAYDDGTLNLACKAQIKIQGASSAGYPKKNYSIKLFNEDGTKNKVKLTEEWGKEFKYCMKANWVDFSQARNVVSGKLYGDVISYRDVEDELSQLVNGGAIDGFPIMVYHNGAFLGLYTMNIPKDKWMFDMKDSDEKNQAIVMGEHWGNSVAMKEPISYNPNYNWTGSSNWELEFASNEESTVDNSTHWVADSLNNLINFVIATKNDDTAFINGIENYADVDKCIDSMLYTFFICADDNVSKNILWVTFDGVHWFSSVYDMDGTWGLKWNGQVAFNENHLLINNFNISNYNLLWQRLYQTFYSRFVERYWELREGPLSYENIENQFTAFFDSIPEIVYTADMERWGSERAKNGNLSDLSENNLDQILTFAMNRLMKMDEILAK